MKLKNHSIIQKIALILVCLIVINFIMPTNVSNADIGGVLFTPVKELFLTVGDVVMFMLDMGFTGDMRWVMWNMLSYEGVNGTDNDRFTADDDKRAILKSKMSPEKIFSNQVELLNVDFINTINENDYSVKSDSATSGLHVLRTTIASWYVAIRNLSLVIMLSILIYVGIRIIISSASQEKAKYKQMLMDWVIGMCLLFMLHYIMSFSVMITKKITQMLSAATNEGITMQEEDLNGSTTVLDSATYTVDGVEYKGGDTVEKLQSLIQYVRYYADLRDLGPAFAFLIMYLFLVFYTVLFAFRYMKRTFIMAFLTVISPFVAMTYPIDKLNDGKAQAFNMWIREYIYNLLIQPFHLVLYTILVGASIDLVSSNLVYGLVAIATILPAEKLLKQMFGLDKASTPSMAAPAIATAAANYLTRGRNSSKSKSGNSGGSSNDGGNSQTPPRTVDNDYNFDSFDSKDENKDSSTTPTGNNNYNSDQQEEMEEGLGLAPGTLNSPYSQEQLDEMGDYFNTQREVDNNENNTPIDEDTRNSMTNNQNAELDAYLNSPAYGNGNGNNDVDRSSSSGGKNFKQKLGKGIGNVGKLGAHAAKKIVRGRTIGKGMKFVAKTALSGAGIIGGAAAGLAVGAMTGNPSMAFTAMAGGAAMGRNLGKTVDVAGNAVNSIRNTGRNIRDSVTNFKDEALYGGQTADTNQENRDIARQRKDYAKNAENIKFFERKTGASGKQLKNIMDRASYFNQMGLGNNEDVLKALEFEEICKQDYGMSDERAQQVAGASARFMSINNYKASDFHNKTKSTEIEQGTQNIVKTFAGNLNSQDQNKLIQQMMTGNRYIAGDTKRQKEKMDYTNKTKRNNKKANNK